MSQRPFTEAEDDIMARLYVAGESWPVIAHALNRSQASLTVHMVKVRRERNIPVRPRGDKPVAEASTYEQNVKPITLHGDDALVRLTLAEGGFPRAVITPVGTVWVGPENKPWRHYTTQRLRGRRTAA